MNYRPALLPDTRGVRVAQSQEEITKYGPRPVAPSVDATEALRARLIARDAAAAAALREFAERDPDLAKIVLMPLRNINRRDNPNHEVQRDHVEDGNGRHR